MRILKQEGKDKTTYRALSEAGPRDPEGRSVYKVQGITEVMHPTIEPGERVEDDGQGQLFGITPARVTSVTTPWRTEPFSEMDNATFDTTMDTVESDFPGVSVHESYSRRSMHPSHSQFVIADPSGKVPEKDGVLLPKAPRPTIKLNKNQFSQHMLPGMPAPENLPPVKTANTYTDTDGGGRTTMGGALGDIIRDLTEGDDFV